MRCMSYALLLAAVLSMPARASEAPASGLLRFPDVWHDRIVFSHAGDLWTVSTQVVSDFRL
jgi:hypothetical protein